MLRQWSMWVMKVFCGKEGGNRNWKIESIPSVSALVSSLPLYLRSLIPNYISKDCWGVLAWSKEQSSPPPPESDLIHFEGRVGRIYILLLNGELIILIKDKNNYLYSLFYCYFSQTQSKCDKNAPRPPTLCAFPHSQTRGNSWIHSPVMSDMATEKGMVLLGRK